MVTGTLFLGHPVVYQTLAKTEHLLGYVIVDFICTSWVKERETSDNCKMKKYCPLSNLNQRPSD